MSLLAKANSGKNKKILFIAAISLLFVSTYIYVVAAGSTDKSWLLFAAKKWLAGGRLYTDIVEVNPPLIVWLYTIPVFISANILPSLSVYNVLGLLMLAVIAGILRLCGGLLARHPALAEEPEKRLWFLLLLAYILVFCTVPMYFSDREHLFLTLTLPYLLRFCPGIARQELPLGLRLGIGVLAAIGFCIKPHTVVVFAVLQLLYIARERSAAILWSAENLVIYLLSSAYVGSILWFFPTYVHTILQMAMETYSAYSRKANGAFSVIIFIIITGITFADFRFRNRSPYRQGVYYFLGICGAYLVYGLINNGWSYTYIPLLSMARLLAGWVLLEFLWLKKDAEAKGEPSRQFAFGVRSCSVNLALNGLFYLICFVAYLIPTDCAKTTQCRGTALFFEKAQAQAPASFGTLSLEFSKWPELVRRTGAKWQTRFNCLWMLPKFILAGAEFREKHAWIIDYVGKAYADDLNTNRPAIVYVDSSPEIFHGHPYVDLPAYLGASAEFREAWSHYRLGDVIDACVKAPKGEPEAANLTIDCRYDVYRRVADQ